MSVESWKAEFMPVSARDSSFKDDIERIDHAIKKWNGMRPANIIKHGLDYKDVRHFGFDTSCALCMRYETCLPYFSEVEERTLDECEGCPLAEIGQRCNRNDSAWKQTGIMAGMTLDPGVDGMIEALERAKQHVLDKLDRIADQKFMAQQLDAAESEDERNAILRENTQ
jgi:hypothetical protein